jgi:hypothetical protein
MKSEYGAAVTTCDFCGRTTHDAEEWFTHRVSVGPPRNVPSAVVGTLTIHGVTHRGHVCPECVPSCRCPMAKHPPSTSA